MRGSGWSGISGRSNRPAGAPLPVDLVRIGALDGTYDLRPHPDGLIQEGSQGEHIPDLDAKGECARHGQHGLHDRPDAIVFDGIAGCLPFNEGDPVVEA